MEKGSVAGGALCGTSKGDAPPGEEFNIGPASAGDCGRVDPGSRGSDDVVTMGCPKRPPVPIGEMDDGGWLTDGALIPGPRIELSVDPREGPSPMRPPPPNP